jgi:hypothetical protein
MGLGIGDDGDPQNTLTKGHSHAVTYTTTETKLNDITMSITASYGRGGVDLATKPLIVQDVANTLTSTGFEKNDVQSCTFIPVVSFTSSSFAGYQEGVGTLRSSGGDLGGGSETLVTIAVPFNKQRLGEYSPEDVASTCAARDYKDATDLVCSIQQSFPLTDVAGCLTSAYATKWNGNNSADTGDLFAMTGDTPCYASQGNMISCSDNAGLRGSGVSEEVCFTQTKTDVHGVATNMQVRRLTPTECERLMGFPDGYTDIHPNGKPTPDGVRYKGLGNSWAVPVVRWIGERIDKMVKYGYVDKEQLPKKTPKKLFD